MNMEEHFNTLEHQDWKPIIVRTNAKNNVTNSKKKVDNTTLKKISIEEKADSDELHHKQLTLELRQSIQKARCAKALTQKQLSNSINLPVQVISDIESGKVIYNAQHINKIKRHLKLK